MNRFEIAQQRKRDALDYIASVPGALDELNTLPDDELRDVVSRVEEKIQSENPQKYATPVEKVKYNGPAKMAVTEHVPVLDPTSEKTLQWFSELTDDEVRELSSTELAAISQALPVNELFPERKKLLRNIGEERTGISEGASSVLAAARGAIPFGSDLLDLSEEEVASLMLQNPSFQGMETTAAVASMFGGSAGGFKLIGKLDKVGKAGRIGLNLLKEGAIGSAYADAAPGIVPELLGKPDDHVLNFIEAAAIAGTFDAGLGLVKMIRGKSIKEARSVISNAAKSGEIPPEVAAKIPDKFNATLSGSEKPTITAGKEPVAMIPHEENPIKRFYETQLKRGGGLPDEAFKTKSTYEGNKQANAHALKKEVRAAQKQLRQKFGTQVPPKDLDDLNRILKGETVTGADETIVEIGNNMRQNIRKGSETLRPYVNEDLQATFDANLDTYVHRSYEVHDNPKWAKKIKKDPNLRDAYSRAFKFLKEQNPDLDDVGVKNILDNIVDPSTYQGDLTDKLMLVGMGRGILKHRKDIPEVLREVMGEFKDPFVNYVKTMTKIDNLVQNKRMVNELIEKGEGKWMFRDPRTAPIPGVKSTPIGGDFDGIKDMYATEDVAKALRTMGEAGPLPKEGIMAAYRYALQAKSASQISKTILSPAAHLRNFTGSAIMAAANGNFSRGGLAMIGGNVAGSAAGAASVDEEDSILEAAAKVLGGAALGTAGGAGIGSLVLKDRQFAHAFKVVANDVLELGRGDLDKVYERYLRENIVESSATFKEMRKVLSDAGAGGYSKIEKLAESKPIKVLFDAYRGQDDIWKMYTHMAEVKKLTKAGLSEEDAWKRATDIVLNNLPNYGRTGRLVQNLRRMPVGNFVSFPAEMIRNTANITRTAIEEMQTPGMRAIGMQRIAGLLGVGMSGAGTMATLSRKINGVSKEDDLRIGEDMAPWERNATRMYVGKDNSAGYPKIKYIDLSYTDPYMYVKQAGITAMNEIQRGGDPVDVGLEVAGRGLSDLLGPFVDLSILTQAISEAKVGVSENGKTIYDKQVDSGGEIITKAMTHVLETAFKPGGMKDMEDLLNPYKHRPSEMMQLASGLRVQTYDPMEALRHRGHAYAGGNREIRTRFSRVAGSKATKPEDVVAKYAETNEKLFEQQQMMFKTIQNSREAGLSELQIRRQLKDAGMSGPNIGLLMRGKFNPYRISGEASRELLQNGVKYPRSEVSKLWADYSKLKLDDNFGEQPPK